MIKHGSYAATAAKCIVKKHLGFLSYDESDYKWILIFSKHGFIKR